MEVLLALFGASLPIITYYLGFKSGWDSKPSKTVKHKNSHQDNLRIYEAGYQDGFRDASNNVDNYGDSPMIMN